MLGRLGFHSTIVRLIMLSVSTVSYSFLLNGSKFRNLNPFRGIRQGDPLSIYFYMLCRGFYSDGGEGSSEC